MWLLKYEYERQTEEGFCKEYVDGMTVYVPESVREIGRWAFHGCSRLERIEILHDPDEIGPWIINRSCTIVCQKGSKVDEYAQEFGFTTEYAELLEELDG